MSVQGTLHSMGEVHIRPIAALKRLCADREFDSTFGRHYNAFVVYIDGGHEFFGEDKYVFASKDTFAFLPAGFKYKNRTLSDPCSYYQIDFEYYIDGKQSKPFDGAFALSGAIVQRLLRICAEIYENMTPGRPYGKLAATVGIIEILQTVLCEIDNPKQSSLADRCYLVMQRFFDSDMSIPDMARASSTSVSNFEKNIKIRCGETPTVLRNRLRTERALELLKEKSLSVSEIARTVGCSDLYYFSRMFKKVTGVSPMTARETM